MAHYLTEDQIERAVEQRTNNLDREYMSNQISTTTYEVRLREISAWADRAARREAV